MTDPLGLTKGQRRISDLTQKHGPYVGALLALNPYFIREMQWACGYCRQFGHTEGECPSVIDGEWC